MKTTKQLGTVIVLLVLNYSVGNAQTNIFESGGNVGIGTTNPLSKLFINAATGEGGSSNPWLSFGYQGYGNYLDMYMDGTGNPNIVAGTNAGNGLYLGANGSTGQLVIKNGGKVGIGTTNPLSKLFINASTGEGGSANPWLSFGYQGYGNYLNMYMDSFGNPHIVSGINAGNGLYFGTNATSGQLVLNNDGKIGIGTATPSQKLSVNGNISAQKVIVTQEGWSDYVFDSSYKLKSLAEVEKFIEKNKHLPDVPSAKEVEDNGLSLGDNQVLLLKKIEELTLYILELSQQNELQQKQIDKILNKKL